MCRCGQCAGYIETVSQELQELQESGGGMSASASVSASKERAPARMSVELGTG